MPFPSFPGAAVPSQPPLPAPVRGVAPAGLSALSACAPGPAGGLSHGARRVCVPTKGCS